MRKNDTNVKSCPDVVAIEDALEVADGGLDVDGAAASEPWEFRSF